jgi:hypothetical protein
MQQMLQEECRRLDQKLTALITSSNYRFLNSNRPAKSEQDPVWVRNLSSATLSEPELNVLAKGFNFALPNRSINPSTFLASLESGITRLHPQARSEIRNTAINALRNYRPHPTRLSGQEWQALNSLRKRDDIVILKADKGNATVVLDLQDYKQKAHVILDDPSNYERLSRDPTAKVERELNRQLLQCSSKARKRLGSSDGICPRFYGLPKLHKPGHPLRPIVSYIRSPLYKISQYLSRLLIVLLSKVHSVSNSIDFCNRIRRISITAEFVMISFDVVSLFPSVPPAFAIETIGDLFRTISTPLVDTTLFSITQTLDLLKFVLNATAFVFDGTFYKQVCGVPMGSPISPVVAEIVMERVESHALNSLTIQPTFYSRFVDDSFSIVHKDHVDGTLSAFNLVHPNIKFTCELENNSELSFLDVLVRRSGDTLSTTVHRKSTHSDRYLSFHSAHPVANKSAVVNSLVRRALLIPSSDELKRVELRRVRQSLLMNGYPPRFIDRQIRKVKYRVSVVDTPLVSPAAASCRVFFPYIPGASERIARCIRKFQLQPVMLPGRRISTLFPAVKDRCGDIDYPGAVYRIPCSGCAIEYVGETERKVRTRVNEHLADIKHFRQKSALSEHCIKSSHSFNPHAVKVLHKPRSFHERYFLEAWEIQVLKSQGRACCNASSGRLTLPAEYQVFFPPSSGPDDAPSG